MKNKLVFIVVLLFCSSAIFAQGRGSGIGFMIGEPSGLNMKWWISSKFAFDVGLAWSVWNASDPNAQQIDFIESRFQFHTDFLYHFYNTAAPPMQKAIIYTGIGGRIRVAQQFFSTGVRFPVGLVFLNKNVPYDFFIELVPVLRIYPTILFTGNFGIGIRWYF